MKMDVFGELRGIKGPNELRGFRTGALDVKLPIIAVVLCRSVAEIHWFMVLMFVLLKDS